MLRFKRVHRWVLLGPFFLCLVACRPKSSPVSVSPAQDITKVAKAPAALGVRGSGKNMVAEVKDKKTGLIAYVIEAKEATMEPGSVGEVLGHLVGNVAILYKEGKPVTRLEAQKVANQGDTSHITATGNVTATSLEGVKQTLRADTMHWDATKNLLTGEKNVVFTQEGFANVPCDHFEADTKLDTVTTYLNN